ncbi:hypothetical protein VMT65_07690 [Nocardia sp. CDC153]|uniref:hypothetical protein n=1 Tax=Nocardia sp. CDC153 TaxID=3112167 RepID=UPI002DBD57F9|nr:hypothetical protein [Nocardia sp. CDC153]MEC3952907.1 hypothetical protein [Nocardia sp. CDC153]
MTDRTTDFQPPIPFIPLFGQSWYERGLGYWTKRALISIALGLLLLLSIVFIWAVVATIIDKANLWPRIALLLLVSAGISWSHYIGFKQVRARRVSQTSNPAARSPGLITGAAAYGGSGIAGALILIGQIFVVGWVTANFVYSLRRYVSPFEVRAVQEMREWYTQHPELPNSQRPKQFRQRPE